MVQEIGKSAIRAITILRDFVRAQKIGKFTNRGHIDITGHIFAKVKNYVIFY